MTYCLGILLASISLYLALIGVLGTAACVLFEYLSWRRMRPLAQQTDGQVLEITDPGCAECIEAMKLYEKRLPASERADYPDMIRWIREDQARRWRPFASRDQFYAVMYSGNVAGLLNFTYYPRTRLAFVSYLVTAKPRRGTGSAPGKKVIHASTALFSKARTFLRRRLLPATGIVVEVEAPEFARNGRDKRECRSRIRLFRDLAKVQTIVMKRLKVDYRQPDLSVNSSGHEKTMALFYARLGRTPLGDQMSRREATRVLRFVYEQVYGDSVLDTPEDREYRAYTRKLCDAVRGQLDDHVVLSEE